MPEWLNGKAPQSDVAISTRIRLARNINEIPFPAKDSPEQRRAIRDTVKEVMLKKTDFEFIPVGSIDELKKQAMLERHLISSELAGIDYGAIIISRDEKLSVMINEEDHLRLQCIEPGFNLEGAFANASELDDMLSSHIPFAFSERFGYLTSCPTNTGTGLRASVMVHLCGIDALGQGQAIVNALSKMGLTVRGLFGEGSAAYAHVYQISNQITLGASERDIMQNLSDAVERVIDIERDARKKVYSSNRTGVENEIMRSLGILKYARLLSTDELRNHASNINFGISLGLIPEYAPATAYTLILDFAPAIMAMAGGCAEGGRDGERAKRVRELLINGA